ESGGETGHPHIHGGDPTPALSSSGTGAVAQSEGEQNHAGKGEENKKQQREKNDRHLRMLARQRDNKTTDNGQLRRSYTAATGSLVPSTYSVAFLWWHACRDCRTLAFWGKRRPFFDVFA